MKKKILYNYNKQFIDHDDIKKVIKTLKSPYLTQGNEIKKFEKNINNYFDSKYCTALSSGTAALFMLGKALNWNKSDLILTSPINFFASVNSIIFNNAKYDFVDINSKDSNLDVKNLEDKILFYKKKNRKVSAVIAVDYSGIPCDWEYLYYLKKKYKFFLINDNCHSLGASYKGSVKYAIKYADAVIHSYHPVKNITTAEGGAVLSNSKKLIDKIRLISNQSIIRSKKRYWHYEINNIGFNFRLNEIQSSLGCSQLKKLNKFIKKRRFLSSIYDKNFSRSKFFFPLEISNNKKSAYHLYVVKTDFDKIGISKDKFISNISQKYSINLMYHYIPLYRQKFYKKKYKYEFFPNSEMHYKSAISLPIHYSLNKSDIEYICNSLESYASQKKRKK